ncbi:MAG: ATP phosphoribosyltransferase regulatory subunit [Moraxella sp.]|nr:ATP phosphoribosyltransferase regulatory subunit [Moraxella sp.]
MTNSPTYHNSHSSTNTQHTKDWLLPDGVSDVLFDNAQKQESLRTALLYVLTSHGFSLVSPPLIEYTETLLKNAPEDLKRQTFKLTDQLNGRLMGVRADITPQILRIDSQHGQGVSRYCYAGQVVKTLPSGLFGLRTPMQLGAEIFGVDEISADLYLINLVVTLFDEIGVDTAKLHLDVGHVGVFRRLSELAGLDDVSVAQLMSLYANKDLPALKALCKNLPLGDDFLVVVMHTFDTQKSPNADTLLSKFSSTVRSDDKIVQMVHDIAKLMTHGQALGMRVSVDIGELSGYHYHTGLIFNLYLEHDRQSQALVSGGRFHGMDKLGSVRPATGFSMDINRLLDVVVLDDETVILVDFDDLRQADNAKKIDLYEQIHTLQNEGCVVITPFHTDDKPAYYDGVLHFDGSINEWAVRLVGDE